MRLRTSSNVLLGITAALTFSGCSGLSELTGGIFSGASGPVFEFQASQFDPEGQTMTIRLPQELVEARGEEAGAVLVSSMKVSSRDLESSEYCAIEVEPEYAANAEDILAEPSSVLGDEERSRVQRIAHHLAPPDTAQELEAFSESEPEIGTYAANDASKFVFVGSCSASLWEEPERVLVFPVVSDEDVEQLAVARISIMKSGSIAVAESSIDGFAIDSEGNWISNS